MKELKVTLSNCHDCPYQVDSNDLLCGHEDAEGDVRIDMSPNQDFPEWCPVQDKDPGVRVSLTAMIVRDGKILLGERYNTETADGLYAYPGGRMDYAETPEDGVIREIFEETGLKCNKETMRFFIFKNEPFPEVNKHYVSLVFVITDFDGEPGLKEPNKCKGWEWFDPFDLPENTFPPIRESIEKNKTLVSTFMVNSEIGETLKQLKD